MSGIFVQLSENDVTFVATDDAINLLDKRIDVKTNAPSSFIIQKTQ